jgi:hypothetical protein
MQYRWVYVEQGHYAIPALSGCIESDSRWTYPPSDCNPASMVGCKSGNRGAETSVTAAACNGVAGCSNSRRSVLGSIPMRMQIVLQSTIWRLFLL